MKYYKIVKKWSENASREVQKSKIFLPRGRGRHFPWTPSPAALARQASARIIGSSDRDFFYRPPPQKKIPLHAPKRLLPTMAMIKFRITESTIQTFAGLREHKLFYLPDKDFMVPYFFAKFFFIPMIPNFAGSKTQLTAP